MLNYDNLNCQIITDSATQHLNERESSTKDNNLRNERFYFDIQDDLMLLEIGFNDFKNSR